MCIRDSRIFYYMWEIWTPGKVCVNSLYGPSLRCWSIIYKQPLLQLFKLRSRSPRRYSHREFLVGLCTKWKKQKSRKTARNNNCRYIYQIRCDIKSYHLTSSHRSVSEYAWILFFHRNWKISNMTKWYPKPTFNTEEANEILSMSSYIRWILVVCKRREIRIT